MSLLKGAALFVWSDMLKKNAFKRRLCRFVTRVSVGSIKCFFKEELPARVHWQRAVCCLFCGDADASSNCSLESVPAMPFLSTGDKRKYKGPPSNKQLSDTLITLIIAICPLESLKESLVAKLMMSKRHCGNSKPYSQQHIILSNKTNNKLKKTCRAKTIHYWQTSWWLIWGFPSKHGQQTLDSDKKQNGCCHSLPGTFLWSSQCKWDSCTRSLWQ